MESKYNMKTFLVITFSLFCLGLVIFQDYGSSYAIDQKRDDPPPKLVVEDIGLRSGWYDIEGKTAEGQYHGVVLVAKSGMGWRVHWLLETSEKADGIGMIHNGDVLISVSAMGAPIICNVRKNGDTLEVKWLGLGGQAGSEIWTWRKDVKIGSK